MGTLPREEENPEVGAVGWGRRSGLRERRVQGWQMRLYGENVLRWRNGGRSVWPERAGAGAKGEVGLNAPKQQTPCCQLSTSLST